MLCPLFGLLFGEEACFGCDPDYSGGGCWLLFRTVAQIGDAICNSHRATETTQACISGSRLLDCFQEACAALDALIRETCRDG